MDDKSEPVRDEDKEPNLADLPFPRPKKEKDDVRKGKQSCMRSD